MKRLVLLGAGGHARAVIDVAQAAGLLVAGVLDHPGAMDCSVPLLGDDGQLDQAGASEHVYLVAVGQVSISGLRAGLFRKLVDRALETPQLVAPSAYVSVSSRLGAGTVVMHRAIVNAGASVGDNCIINTGAVVEHDAKVGNHCHVSTGAILNGDARLGDGSMLGSGAVVLQGVQIGAGVLIGAGSVVTHNINTPGTYIGVPARKIQ